MYELKPVLYQFNINTPKCMYKMKPLNDIQIQNDIQREVDAKGSLEMNDLELRQEKLLKQLESLRNQLSRIKSHLNTSTLVFVEENTQSNQYEMEKKYEIPNDIVVNASPDCIPYGLLALKNVWKDVFTINVKVHSHSTITSLNQEASEFQNQITQDTIEDIDQKNRNSPHINITLIWKNSEHTEMITSSAMYVPIYGEVNILRYLSRLGPINYRYENSTLACCKMDAVLDISYQLPCCCGGKTKSQLLKSLNACLEKQKYFGGENLSIADVGAYSAIKRSLWLTKKDLTENLISWFERVKLIAKI